MLNIFSFFKGAQKTNLSNYHPLFLLILDGWGIAPPSNGNAISLARKPNYDKIISLYPSGSLLASGESVGLPANEVGNTEVGHLNIGAGRIIDQDIVRISKSIKDGSFFYNPVLIQLEEHVKENKSKLHIMGMASYAGVHSSLEHMWALIEYCQRNHLDRVYLHLFTDGRDSPPNQGIEVISKIQEQLNVKKSAKIATISGRYWAMDRDKRWERTKKAYEAIVLGRGLYAADPIQAIQNSYNSSVTDEFIQPTVIIQNNQPVATVDDGDAVIFFNFRIDRPRQLTMAFVLPNFESLKSFDFGYTDSEHDVKYEGEVKFSETFKREKVPQNLFFATMTEYQKGLPVNGILFEEQKISESLGEVISYNKIPQLHLAESEKERFVTYYFNGMREEKFEGEEDLIVPSPKVPTYDKKPEMSVFKLANEAKNALLRGVFGFFVCNFANPDMVAHTGNLQATIKAIEAVDKALGIIYETILQLGGTLVITADHGNAEELLTFSQTSYFFTSSEGQINTDHSSNPVPLIIVNKGLEGTRKDLGKGILADVAPTILSLMNLGIPSRMTGRNLLK